MKRRILKADVKLVSLCKRGVNGLSTLFKGEGAKLQALVKAGERFDEAGELLAVVAAPGLVDLEGDVFASPDVIRAAAHSFMRSGGQLDLQHDMKPLARDAACVLESFVIQKGDARFADWKDYQGRAVDVTGGWGMLISIGDEALRKGYRNGDWDGVSLFAPAATLDVLEKSVDADIKTALRSLFQDAGLIDNQETDAMTPDQIAALTKSLTDGIAAALKPVTDVLAKGVKPDGKPAGGPGDDSASAPVFSGDPTNPADLRKHQAALEAHRLLKSGDLSDPAKVEALAKAAEKRAADEAAAKDPVKAREELRKSNPALAKALDDKDAAEARVKALEKGSNAGEGGEDEPAATGGAAHLVKAGLVKASEAPNFDAARKAAQAENKRRQAAHPYSTAGK